MCTASNVVLSTFRFFFNKILGVYLINAIREFAMEREDVITMDKNRIVGSAKEVKGSIKEGIGKATGDAKLQADGRADKAKGKVQNAIGGIKDAVRDSMTK